MTRTRSPRGWPSSRRRTRRCGSAATPQTKEQLVAVAGQLHVEIAVARLRRRYKVDVTLQPPKVPYRETITRAVEITTRHKKQTGGHGQFAEARIRLEPLPRGTGYEFVDKIFGGSISQNYRPSVDKGIQASRAAGPLSGNPVVDFRVTLLDGKEHPVDSSDMAFQICGRKAFREGVRQASPTILEPIMQVGRCARPSRARGAGSPRKPVRRANGVWAAANPDHLHACRRCRCL